MDLQADSQFAERSSKKSETTQDKSRTLSLQSCVPSPPLPAPQQGCEYSVRISCEEKKQGLLFFRNSAPWAGEKPAGRLCTLLMQRTNERRRSPPLSGRPYDMFVTHRSCVLRARR